MIAVSVRAWPLTEALAAIAAVPALVVRTTARTGLSRRPPCSDRALVSIVTVYRVSGCQCAIGAIVSCRPAASHVTLMALSGETRRAPATDAASIGESNLTSMGAVTG